MRLSFGGVSILDEKPFSSMESCGFLSLLRPAEHAVKILSRLACCVKQPTGSENCGTEEENGELFSDEFRMLT